ncbi:MAG: mechanosensitive ion channel [Gammaproteobacteria bacterium]
MELDYLVKFVEITLIVVAGYFANYFTQRTLFSLQRNGKLDGPMLFPLLGIIKWFIVVLVVLLVLYQLGISLTVILTSVSGILMLVAIGFVAVWSVLSNVSCSFLLLVFPPFKFGDTIEIKEAEKEFGMKGKVIGLNLFYTTLAASDSINGDTLIRVPNNLFFQRVIICHSGEKTEDLKVSIREDFLHDTDKV